METEAGSDKELGFAIVFGALGLLGALGMYLASLNGTQTLVGWGFAGAMLAGVLAIAALHVYE